MKISGLQKHSRMNKTTYFLEILLSKNNNIILKMIETCRRRLSRPLPPSCMQISATGRPLTYPLGTADVLNGWPLKIGRSSM